MAEEERKKKVKKQSKGAPDWIVTYGDLMSLLLTFFIMLLSPARIDGEDLRLILANFPGLGNFLGGESFNEGRLPHSGQVFESLPSSQRGTSLDRFREKSVSALNTELTNRNIELILTERALIVSLASDIFFDKYSANLNIEENGSVLVKIANLMRNFIRDNPETYFRVEGYTDETVLPTGSPYLDEWGLSAARAVSTLRFLEKMLVPVTSAQVAGLGNTKSRYVDEESGIGSTLNRRVDIVILNEGNL